jgi:putative phosphonate catabolism associated alcohol dehydrogenase
MKEQISGEGRAVVFQEPGEPFEMIRAEKPEVGRGELLVRNLYTTICGSDIHTYCGRRKEPSRVVLGHEIVGEILSIGPDHKGTDLRGNMLRPGQRITWTIFSVPPGVSASRADIPQKSSGIFKYGHALAQGSDVFNGGLADYCLLRENTEVVIISNDIPLPVAAPINCAHATIAGGIRIAGDIAGKKVLIFGAGMLGISCIAQCRVAGAEWIGVVDSNKERLDFAMLFKADDVFHVDGGVAYSDIPKADIVFDLTGDPKVMQHGLEHLAIGGISIWIGAAFPAPAVQVDAEMVVRNILQIRGLHNYNYEDLLRAANFIEENHQAFPFWSLVEKEFVLEKTGDAFEFASHEMPVRTGIIL